MGVHNKTSTDSRQTSLCETCTHAHIERGFRESEETVICGSTYTDHRVTFRVRECTGYVETRRQSLRQMEEIAWWIEPRGPKRPAGFAAGDEVVDSAREIKIVLEDSKC